MTPVQEEIFGPVVVVMPFDDDDEAIAIANGTDFGLYDYVFSQDVERGLPYGPSTAHRQRRDQHRAAQPRNAFGGFKLSGIGRDGGDFGLHAYTEMQSIVW